MKSHWVHLFRLSWPHFKVRLYTCIALFSNFIWSYGPLVPAGAILVVQIWFCRTWSHRTLSHMHSRPCTKCEMSGYPIGQDARIPSLHCHPFFFLDGLHVRQKGLVGEMTITESVAASSPSTPCPLHFKHCLSFHKSFIKWAKISTWQPIARKRQCQNFPIQELRPHDGELVFEGGGRIGGGLPTRGHKNRLMRQLPHHLDLL